MAQVVRYTADGTATEVSFEIEPPEGFRPVGAADVAGHIHEAMAPVVAAARDVLEDLKALRPDGVEVRFGVKVTGTANWLVAKAASEGSFEVKLSWERDRSAPPEPDQAPIPDPAAEPEPAATAPGEGGA